MTEYKVKESTPLAYHAFFRWVFLPISILRLSADLVKLLRSYDFIILSRDTPWYLAAPLILFPLLSFAMLALCIVAIIGCFHWKPYAWYSIMTLMILNLINLAFSFLTAVLIPGVFSAQEYVTLFGQAIVSILILIYYRKRKLLFIPDLRETTGQIPQNFTSWSANYCPRCGRPLENNFCPYCQEHFH